MEKAIPGQVPRPSIFNQQTLWGLLFLGALGWSVSQIGFGRDLVNPGGWPLVVRFLKASLRPELSLDFLALVGQATLTTLAYAVSGTAFSVLLGLVGGVFSSQVWWQALGGKPAYRLIWLGTRSLLAAPRAIHEVLWGLFFVNILGLVPLTAILAIAIPFGATCAKVFSEILDETPRQPMEALVNSGVSPFKAFSYGLIPLAFPNLLSYAFYRFECSIRAAAVLGIIGAGGLGYEIYLSLQSLRYEQMWTLFFALFLLSGLTDRWSGLLRRHLGLNNRLSLIRRPVSRGGQRTGKSSQLVKVSLAVAAGLLVFSFWHLRPDFGQLFSPRTAALLVGVTRDALPLKLDPAQIYELLHLSLQTLAMSILAISLAAAGGLLLSFPGARNPLGNGTHSNFKQMSFLLTRGILLVWRSIPAPIWALILLFVMFPGILPGALALGIYTLGILGRLMAESIENLDARPISALKDQGTRDAQVFFYGIMPGALPSFLAYSLYRWEVGIRATVVVGLVGAGGLGRLLTEQLSSFDYPAVAATILFFMLLIFGGDLISSSARRALR